MSQTLPSVICIPISALAKLWAEYRRSHKRSSAYRLPWHSAAPCCPRAFPSATKDPAVSSSSPLQMATSRRDKEGQGSENPSNTNPGLGSLFGKEGSFFFLSDFIRFYSCYILYGSGTYGWGSFSSLNEDSPSLECCDRLSRLTSTQCVQIFPLSWDYLNPRVSYLTL